MPYIALKRRELYNFLKFFLKEHNICMHIFSQLYENVFTISLILPEEKISETSASAEKLIVFIKFYIKIIYDIFGLHLFVRIHSNCPKKQTGIILKKLPR